VVSTVKPHEVSHGKDQQRLSEGSNHKVREESALLEQRFVLSSKVSRILLSCFFLARTADGLFRQFQSSSEFFLGLDDIKTYQVMAARLSDVPNI
jgi:hypothetical protein